LTRKLKIAFLLPGSKNWLGGLNYQLNLMEALLHFEPNVEIHTIISKINADIRLPQSPSVYKQVIENHPILTELNAGLRRFLKRDFLAENAIRKTGAGVIFTSFPYVAQVAPTLYWIPDFQHVHLPEMFTPQDISGRNSAFRVGAAHAERVVLSSRDAMADFTRLFPSRTSKARLLHFVVNVPESIYDKHPLDTLRTYALPQRFFYLPNQLWRHKNHLVVFEALHILQSRNIYPIVVCTGNAADYRNPDYHREVMDKIQKWGLSQQVIFLGLTPREHVFQLVRQSIAVINPSLFEGWSTIVEEVKSIGKQVLLSDIPVHREQSPPESVYFSPKDSNDLADKMAAAWSDYADGPDLRLESCARSSISERVAAFTNQFVSMVREILPN